MVSSSSGWIIVAILIFFFLVLGLFAYYYIFVYLPEQQMQDVVKRGNLMFTPGFPADTTPTGS